MADANISFQSAPGNKILKRIPLVITYAAGVPSVTFNPENEAITLTDTGVGNLLITLSDAALAPLMVSGLLVRPTDPTVLGLIANLNGAASTTAVSIVVNSGADGATETDPVSISLELLKMIQPVAS